MALDASAGVGTGSGVDKVEFQSSPAGAGTWSTFSTDNTDNAGTYHGSWVTPATFPDGLYDLRVVITDKAGLSAPGTNTVTSVRVDNTLPTVTLGGVTGTRGARVVPLTATADGTGSAVHSVAFGYRLGGRRSRTRHTARRSTAADRRGCTTSRRGHRDRRGGQRLTRRDRRHLGRRHVAACAREAHDGFATVSAAPTITFVPTDPIGDSATSGVEHYDVYRNGPGRLADQRRPIAAGGP